MCKLNMADQAEKEVAAVFDLNITTHRMVNFDEDYVILNGAYPNSETVNPTDPTDLKQACMQFLAG